MSPILNGPQGFILLTLSVGLCAYVRQMYVGCADAHDRIVSGDLKKLWPPEAEYTKCHIDNLVFVQKSLRIVTFLMFFLIFLLSLRLLAYAGSAMPIAWLHVSDSVLDYCDFGLISYLAIACCIMWLTYWMDSKKERAIHHRMYAALMSGPLEPLPKPELRDVACN